MLAEHMKHFLPEAVEIEDRTDPLKPVTRVADLLFATTTGKAVRRSSWSGAWAPAVSRCGLVAGFGVHGLRHYYATLLIHGGASVKTVQLALGHSSPTITLDTYTHEWPDALDRTRNLVDAALGEPVSAPAEGCRHERSCTHVVPASATLWRVQYSAAGQRLSARLAYLYRCRFSMYWTTPSGTRYQTG